DGVGADVDGRDAHGLLGIPRDEGRRGKYRPSLPGSSPSNRRPAGSVRKADSRGTRRMIPLEDIRAAARRLSGRVHRTGLLTSRTLSERCGAPVALKCECFQKTGSFKPRGALNKVLSLPEDQRRRGLVTVSAGNHAQAVAWAARSVGVACVVVMPEDA